MLQATQKNAAGIIQQKVKRVIFGTQLCKKSLSEYNSILNGDVFMVKITDTNKNEILCDKIISGNIVG